MISEAQTDLWFYTQVLTGDSTDGYRGCPGIGRRKAQTILSNAGDHPWRAILSAFEAKGLSEEDALVQAQAARILRATDYDFGAKRPILWTPTKGDAA